MHTDTLTIRSPSLGLRVELDPRAEPPAVLHMGLHAVDYFTVLVTRKIERPGTTTVFLTQVESAWLDALEDFVTEFLSPTDTSTGEFRSPRGGAR